ncbi:SusC/RagA family TonB-linked outer membrane protein [Membranihabitans maritimus]|uniref:SusC/RagA family TonB-linked outer membrane protein n=1 Tax=Membranihabitans maritimus TaxID=2904244 RepID=UPI001F361CA6|nr:TonB-dependent receptor [Membranihabitans maritimus]
MKWKKFTQTILLNSWLIASPFSAMIANNGFEGETLLNEASTTYKVLALEKNVNVTGMVTDENGEPLIGVNILVKGTDNGTSTDFDGSFTLQDVAEDAILVVTYVGYQKQEIELEGRTSIDIRLQSDAQMLDELVVVGYGTVKKSDLTGSVQRVDAAKFKDQSMTQLTDMLTGSVAGFNANQSTSAAGGSSLEVRGPTSLTANTEPLIVLDGVIFNGSLRDINPNDVETIDILKDASSAAVFGSKAASGVILITTTKGKTGKPTINFSTKLGLTEATSDAYGVRGPDEYIDFRKAYYRGNVQPFPDYYWDDPANLSEGVSLDEWRNLNPNPLPDNTREYLSRLNFFPTEIDAYLAGETIDWFDETMRTGLRQEYDLSISGGTENSSYYWSVGYVNNEGIIRGDEYSTIRSRLNVDFKVTNWLNAGANTQFSVRDESSVTASIGGMQTTSPFAQMRNEDGTLKWYPGDYIGGQNPLINTLGQDRDRKLNNLFTSLYAKVTLPFGITYKLSFQPRIEDLRDYNYWSPQTIVGGQNVSGGRADRTDFARYEWMIDNLVKWNKTFGIHNFDVTLLYNKEQNRTWNSYSVNNTFQPSPVLGYSGIQFGINPALDANDTKITGDAMMARLNYTLMDKYLITASIRRDGFSAFGQLNPRANFPAGAFAWKLSEEDFFNINGIDQAKVRLSYGVNGNRDIGAYSALAQLTSNQYYDGSQVQIGVFTSSLANPGLIWEETESFNVGIDLGILENRINVSLDYYDMTTQNLLVNRTLPRITGFSDITTNIGELGNKGFEMMINSVNISSENFNWRTTFNLSLNRNEIISLFGESGNYTLEGQQYEGEIPDFENEWFIGRPIDAVWNYDIVGVWQEEEADEAETYGLEPGDLKGADLNNNGTYEALDDKTFIGYEQPRYRLGLRNEFNFLQNFSASIFLRADLGHIGAFSHAIHRHSTYDRRNTPPTPYWTAENRSNEWPRLGQNDAPYGGGIMVFKSREFVRIQDVTLNYTLPSEIAQVANFQSLRVFASIRNLATFTEWPGWDPESGINSPMPRTYTVGLSMSL